MFIHENNYEPFPELQTVKYNGMRFYETPEGLKFPSITTVIDKQRAKSDSLQKWRERIGEEAAKLITRKAAARGTAFHHICEDYINNIDIEEHTKLPVNKVVIMMVSENATVQIWEKSAKDFVPRLEELIENFYDTIVADLNAN